MISIRDRIPENDENEMPVIFLSLLLVLITFFIVLTRFVETDPQKVAHFKKEYNTALFLEVVGKGLPANEPIKEQFSEYDPLLSLVNRMKSVGITEPLMNQFLSMNHIKELRVIAGESGLVLRLPNPVRIERHAAMLNERGMEILNKLKVLFVELPYIIEVRGVGLLSADGNEFSVLEEGVAASQKVYRHLIGMGIIPQKIKISGTTDRLVGEEDSFVELSFRENS